MEVEQEEEVSVTDVEAMEQSSQRPVTVVAETTKSRISTGNLNACPKKTCVGEMTKYSQFSE